MSKHIPTPWGVSDHVTPIAHGILQVDTPSHGGIFVPRPRYRTMPEPLRHNPYGGDTWFEEDMEWGLVVLAFPEFFTPRERYYAVHTFKDQGPESTYAGAAAWLRDTAQGRILLATYGSLPAPPPSKEDPTLIPQCQTALAL